MASPCQGEHIISERGRKPYTLHNNNNLLDVRNNYNFRDKYLKEYRVKNTNTAVSTRNKGGKFLKKLWCCVGGNITR